MSERPHDALPNQREPQLAASRPRSRGREARPPCLELMEPYSAKVDFQYCHLKQRACDNYSWKPRSETYRLGFYPTLCYRWKPSFANLKFEVAHP